MERQQDSPASDPILQEAVGGVAPPPVSPPSKRDSFIMSFIPSRKKSSLLFLAVFLVLMSGLGAGLALVKKSRFGPSQAEVSQGQITDKCGRVTLEQSTENYDISSSTYTLSVPIKNNTSSSISVKLHWEKNYCADGNQQNCDENEEAFDEDISLAPNEKRILQKSVKQRLGNDCGSLQIDVGVISVNNDTSCTTIGTFDTAVWGVHKTGKDCSGVPSPPPGEHPDCTALNGPSVGAPGDTLAFTAHPTGNNLVRVEFWLISEVDVNQHGLCPSSEWAPVVWSKIRDDNDGSDGWSASWNTTGYTEGRYFIAANVYSDYGGNNWWCTGNEEGPCDQDANGKSCPACSKWVELKTSVSTPTPTPPPATPTLTPIPPTSTPVPTAPVTYECHCDSLTADRSLDDLAIGDEVNFACVGITNDPAGIKTIRFTVNRDGTAVRSQGVDASFDHQDSGWDFYQAFFNYTIEEYGDHGIVAEVACPGE